MAHFGKVFFVVVLFAFSLMIVSVGNTMTADKSVDFSVKEATKQAMYVGIKKGCVRVDENIVLDEEVTKEALVRSYSELSRYDQGVVDLYVHEFSSYPAMLSTEAYHVIDTPFQKFLNLWNKTDKSSEATVREFEAAIFEAKGIIRPITSDSPTNPGTDVENFQCS